LSTEKDPLKEQDQSILEQIKPAYQKRCLKKLNATIRRNQELLERLQKDNRLLRELRRSDLLEKYSPSAETLSDEQLELLELEPGVSNTEVEAESQREQLSLPLKTAPVRNHPGRRQLPAELPRQEQIIGCTAAQCVCGKCGKPTSVIGYETSEVLHVEPVKYFVRVIKREKRACKALSATLRECRTAELPCFCVLGRTTLKPIVPVRVSSLNLENA
jgi:hypothetical protein